jgi:hypothetical protein
MKPSQFAWWAEELYRMRWEYRMIGSLLELCMLLSRGPMPRLGPAYWSYSSAVRFERPKTALPYLALNKLVRVVSDEGEYASNIFVVLASSSSSLKS